MLEMALQVVLVVLLLAAIGWSALLHRRLATLRRGGDGIGQFVSDLMTATGRAETAIREMRAMAEGLGRHWQRQRGEAEALAGELRQLVTAAEDGVRALREATVLAPAAAETFRQHATRQSVAASPLEWPERTQDPVSPHERIRQAIRDLR
ncbi:DUF6468 domain-containing protein [Geminicoccus flavidas]|uniref:DUF6468 domain-containing protein n=1 Tax=Geminicoccus flavidas TaxID=2506407 RepID=UPI0013590D27|nr:DUF6468 domain-containing protein [Geminicoccus flavidas]